MIFSMQLFSLRPYELEDDSVAAAAAAAAPFLFLFFVFLYFPYFGKMVTWIVPVFYLSSIFVFSKILAGDLATRRTRRRFWLSLPYQRLSFFAACTRQRLSSASMSEYPIHFQIS